MHTQHGGHWNSINILFSINLKMMGKNIELQFHSWLYYKLSCERVLFKSLIIIIIIAFSSIWILKMCLFTKKERDLKHILNLKGTIKSDWSNTKIKTSISHYTFFWKEIYSWLWPRNKLFSGWNRSLEGSILLQDH